jgi:hypothetical protein
VFGGIVPYVMILVKAFLGLCFIFTHLVALVGFALVLQFGASLDECICMFGKFFKAMSVRLTNSS